jgi:hypothetical protein
MRKAIKERGREVGELFTLLDRKTPVAFGAGTEDTYFPAKCLTDIASYEDVSETNWPDLVPKLRSILIAYNQGLPSEINSPAVTNWAISANVATLTFESAAYVTAMLSALAEDATAHGSFTNWRTVTLASAIGNITAGTYAITAINPASRTVSFAFTAANASGSVTATVQFFAHRVAGSITTARLFSARGLTMHGANDDNLYFMASGLRRRGFMQGHRHNPLSGTNFVMAVGASGYTLGGSGAGGATTGDPTTDGTNGTPRVGKETHGPAITAHIYIHGGRYNA